MMEEKEAVIPVDPSIATGALHNGLRYYVQHNSRPSRRVVLRLVVRVGSLHEEEHERGLAHFVEHMGFKATRSYGRGELVKYFESIGAGFGADLNAHTGLDQTVYKISIPVPRHSRLVPGRQGAGEHELRKAMGVLREWA